MEKRHDAADWCLNLCILTPDLLWEEMCIVCQHIAIVASNQDNLKWTKIPNFDMIGTMRYALIDVATDIDSCRRSREI